MSDDELIKTAATAAHYTQHIPTKMLLEMLAHRLEELTKELAEAKVAAATYPGATATLVKAGPVADEWGLQP